MSRIKLSSHSFLVQNFHEFFNLMLRQKEFALRANEGKDPFTLEKESEQSTVLPPYLEAKPETISETPPLVFPEFPEEEEPVPVPVPPAPVKSPILETPIEDERYNALVNTIQRRLSIILEEQALQSTIQAGEFAVSSYQDALYAMVAFADEVFLNIPWSGQKHWENNLLESRFFQTQIAGELIFDKIDALLSTNDPMRTDLAIVYLLILGLGFKGKFRNEDSDPQKLSLYRQQLYVMVNRHPSTLYEPGRDHLIEECYDYVLDSTISKGLPEIRMWLYTFVGILGVYLFTSTVLWYTLVRDMDSSVSNILYQAQQMGMS